MNKEQAAILNKVDEIIRTIKNSPDYQKYLLLKDKMNSDVELINLINEIKVMQKRVVNGFNCEFELNNLQNELNNYPLYREYINTISDINNQFVVIENVLNNYFGSKFN